MFNVKLATQPALEPAIWFDMEETVKLPRLRSLIVADLAGDFVVSGCLGGWTIGVYLGPVEPVRLAAASGAVRIFTTSDSAIHQLIRLGVTRFEVIADEYEAGSLRAPRPDRAVALRQQADYDGWLESKVAATLARLATGEETLLSPEESQAAVVKLRDNLLKGQSGH